MSKLTEIKESFNNHEPWWWGISKDDMKYIFSLLEEKDKALTHIQERAEIELDEEVTGVYNLKNGLTMIRKKAYEALNTSSNTKGEI